MTLPSTQTTADHRTPLLEIFAIFLRLGCTSFGGPIAHLGFFRTEFVERRKWLTEHAYADLVALCQFLPGPASSQVGIGLGLFRGGVPGAVAAWLGFTLPSAIVLVLFGLILTQFAVAADSAWLHGLKVAAVAVVAQAVWGMAKNLCPDRQRATMAVLAATVALWVPGVLSQIAILVAGALLGWLWIAPIGELPHSPFPISINKRIGVSALILFFSLLLALPQLASQNGSYVVKLFDSFYRAGALVFGGGHVVLPVLQAEVVPPGWVSSDAFLAGYGAAQAVPGPLFTFAAYLGAISTKEPHGWLGAGVALVAIFLPGFLLLIGALPVWERARRYPAMQRAMLGINAMVVGLLLAAFYNPVWVGAIHSGADFTLATGAFLLFVFWRVPPWIVVVLCAVASGVGWR